MFVKTLLSGFVVFAASPFASAQTNKAPDISYDTKHIAYIKGKGDNANEKDLSAMFGLGYSQVRNFPVLTLTNIWNSTDEQARLYGQGPHGAFIMSDAIRYHWQIRKIADEQWRLLQLDTTSSPSGAHIAEMIQAYVDGLNAAREWWAGNSNYQKLQLNHGYTVSAPTSSGLSDTLFSQEKVEHLFSVGEAEDLMKIKPEHILMHALKHSGAFPKDEKGSFSNCWMIPMASATEGKSTRLVGDPHHPNDNPLFRKHFVTIEGGNFKVSGMVFLGLPFVVEGYNNFLGWVGAGAKVTPLAKSAWFVTATENSTTHEISFTYNNGTSNETVTVIDENPAPNELYPPHVEYFDYGASPPAFVPTAIPPEVSLLYVPKPGAAPNTTVPWERYPVHRKTTDLTPEPIWKVTVPGSPPVTNVSTTTYNLAFSAAVALDDPANNHSTIELFMRLAHATTVGQVEGVATTNIYFYPIQLLVGDNVGGRYFTYPVRNPIPGSASTSVADNGKILWYQAPMMPGNHVNYRWAGYYSYANNPQKSLTTFGNVQPWIGNNASPDFIVNQSGIDNDVTAPSQLSWRYLRAKELLTPYAGTQMTNADMQKIATDKTDPWVDLVWKNYIVKYVNNIAPSGGNCSAPNDFSSILTSSADRAQVIDFVNAIAGKAYEPSISGPDDLATLDKQQLGFSTVMPALADRRSSTMPWMNLVRDLYEDEIDKIAYAGTSISDDNFNQEFAPPDYSNLHFARFPLDSAPPYCDFLSSNYYNVREKLIQALKIASAVYGSRDYSLNHLMPDLFNNTIYPFSSPAQYPDWPTPRPWDTYDPNTTTQLNNYYFADWDPSTGSFDASGYHNIRWGHCNQLIMNRGSLAFPVDLGPVEQWTSQNSILASLFDGIVALTYASIAFTQSVDALPVAIYPMDGTRHSLFVTTNIHSGPKSNPGSSVGAIRYWDPNWYYWIPNTAGSQAIIEINVPYNGNPSGRYLQMFGNSEFLSNLNSTTHEKDWRTLTTLDFVNGVFNDLPSQLTGSSPYEYSTETEFHYPPP